MSGSVLKVLHVFDHSLPLMSGYSMRSLALIEAQHRMGWETGYLTTPKHYMAGPTFEEVYRHVAVLANKVLRGVRPADLPIEQPTVFTLAVNPRAAREIGLQLPADMMLRADLVVD